MVSIMVSLGGCFTYTLKNLIFKYWMHWNFLVLCYYYIAIMYEYLTYMVKTKVSFMAS